IDAIDKEGVEGSRMQILEGLLRLRQICCHPAMVDETFAGDSGKFRLLEQSLVDIVSEGHRVLVFSQFVKALELVRGRIAQQGIQSEMLTGGTRDRGAVVDRFQNKRSAPVFLISLKAGGTGLNLTSADYVIHLDPWWNPSAENQASDRAYRIGQTRTVFVYKVITKDSIEERVLALQDQKKQLVQSVIQTESSFFKQLNRDDVLGLLD
ncbi:MAG: DEAD/DEAH box helicase, partial [Chitinispirillaceae bacterium]